MSRRGQKFWALLLAILTPLSGCTPSRTFYFHEDGDLSHYRGMANNIEFPDVESNTLEEVRQSHAPLTLKDFDDYEIWNLCLEEAVQTALNNGKIVRLLQSGFGGGVLGRTSSVPGQLLANPAGATTVYDPALQQSNPGVGGRIGGGVEAALSAFDAQLSASMLWERNEQARNVRLNNAINQIFVRDFEQDLGTFQAQISKTAATGAQFTVQNNTVYDANNNPSRDVYSDYNTNFQVEARQPLLQGGGTLFNRIAGPGLGPGNFSGVVIARINGDIALADFEAQVTSHVKQVEDAYWNLYFSYRAFDAARIGRDSVLKAWRRVKALSDTGSAGGGALEEARARQELFSFEFQVQESLRQLYSSENRLRYLMGLAPTDGRLIRPSDEPTTARVEFDWVQVNGEALARNVALRRQKWQIKSREMQLIASKNFLLPRLDGIARYRWLGLGDDLISTQANGVSPTSPTIAGTNAFSTLTNGDYQEWEMGVQFNMPLGFRRELAGVRNAELALARERAVLQEQELELCHQLTETIRNLQTRQTLVETNFNRGIAAKREVEAAQAVFDTGAELDRGISALDRLLDAQRRYADAIRSYYDTLIDYNQTITEVHFRKGSLLEYNNIFLAEGPWPLKAYYDAQELARKRDAGHFINYGYTRPSVFSRGVYDQFSGQHAAEHQGELGPTPADPEVVPTPGSGNEEAPLPGSGSRQPNIPQNNSPQNSLPQNNLPQNNLPRNNLPQINLPPQPEMPTPGPAAGSSEGDGPRLSAAGGEASGVGPSRSQTHAASHASTADNSNAMNWKTSRR